MKLEDLVEELGAFGFGVDEAQVYYHLSRLGPSQASDVVQASGIQRSKVYRTLDELEARGAVERTLERPQRFVARPLEDVLDLVLSERRIRLEELTEGVSELVEAWPRPGTDEVEDEVRFTVLEGRAQIRGLLGRMVEGAREEVVIIALRRGLSRLGTLGLLEALKEETGEDTLLRVVTEVNESNLETAEEWAKVCEVRHVSLPGYHQAVIVDNREIALFVAVDPLVSVGPKTEETVLSLNARDFVLSQKALADMLWDAGLDLEDRRAELETGQPAQRTEVVRGRWTRYNKAKDMVYRARSGISVVVPEGEAGRLEEAGISRLLERKVQEGIEVRILTEARSRKVEGATVRQGARDGLPAALLLVDDVEALSVLSGAHEGDSVTLGSEWSVWTTLEEEVQRLCTLFAEAWKGAGGS